MLEFLIVILVAIVGYIFLRSQGESAGGLGITFRPYPNTLEGRKRRAQGLIATALIFGVIAYVFLHSQSKNPIGFILIVLSALIVVLISTKKSK